MPNNVLPLDIKQAFPPIIWIFSDGEGDGMESRLPFKNFSTLKHISKKCVLESVKLKCEFTNGLL